MVLNLLGGFFLLASWLAPNHYVPWTSFHSEAAAFFALILLCLNRIVEKSRDQSYAFCGFFVVLIAVILLQYCFGLLSYFGTAVLGCMYVAGGMLAWWLGRNSRTGRQFDEETLTSLAWLICTGAVLSIILAVLQWLGMDADIGIFIANRGPGMRPFGNFAQPNHLATFCLMAVASAHVLHTQKKISLHFLFFLVAIFAFGVKMAESRTAVLSFAGMTVFLIILSKKINIRRYFSSVAWMWLVLIFLQLIWSPLNEFLLLEDSRQVSLTHDNIRLTFWAQFAKAITLAPWQGYGWTQGVIAQQSAALSVPGQLGTIYAHNVVLDWFAWLGIPIGAAFMLLGFVLFTKLIQNLNHPTAFWLFCGVIPFLVHSLLEFPFAYAYFIFPVIWMLGYLKGAPLSNLFKAHAIKINFIILIIFSSVGFQILREYMAIEEDFRVMRFELRQVGQRPLDYRRPDVAILTQLEAVLIWGRFTPKVDMVQTDVQEICKIATIENWAALQVKCAISLYLVQEKIEALNRFKLVRAVHGKEVYSEALSYLKDASVHEYKNTNLNKMIIELAD